MGKLVNIIIAVDQAEYDRHKNLNIMRILRLSGLQVNQENYDAIAATTIHCHIGTNGSLEFFDQEQAKKILEAVSGDDVTIHLEAHGTIAGVNSNNGAEYISELNARVRPGEQKTITPEVFVDKILTHIANPQSVTFHLACCNAARPFVDIASEKRAPNLQDRLHDAACIRVDTVKVIAYSESVVTSVSSGDNRVRFYVDGTQFSSAQYKLLREYQSGRLASNLKAIETIYTMYKNADEGDKDSIRGSLCEQIKGCFGGILSEVDVLTQQQAINSPDFLSNLEKAVKTPCLEAILLYQKIFPEPRPGTLDCVLSHRDSHKLHHLDYFEQSAPRTLQDFKINVERQLKFFLTSYQRTSNEAFANYVSDGVMGSIRDKESLVSVAESMETALSRLLNDKTYAGMIEQDNASIPNGMKEALQKILEETQTEALKIGRRPSRTVGLPSQNGQLDSPPTNIYREHLFKERHKYQRTFEETKKDRIEWASKWIESLSKKSSLSRGFTNTLNFGSNHKIEEPLKDYLAQITRVENSGQLLALDINLANEIIGVTQSDGDKTALNELFSKIGLNEIPGFTVDSILKTGTWAETFRNFWDNAQNFCAANPLPTNSTRPTV